MDASEEHRLDQAEAEHWQREEGQVFALQKLEGNCSGLRG